VNFLYQLQESNAALMLPLAAHRQQATELKWTLDAFRDAYQSVDGVCQALTASGSVKTLRDNLYILARHMLPRARASLRKLFKENPSGVAVAWDFPVFIREVEKYQTTAKGVAGRTLLYFLVTAVRKQEKNKDNWLQDAANTLQMQMQTLRDSSTAGVLELKMITVKALDAALNKGRVVALREAVLEFESPLLVAARRLEEHKSLTSARVAEVEKCRKVLTEVMTAQPVASRSYDALCEKLGVKSATAPSKREDALEALDVLRELLATAMKQSPEPVP